MKIKITLAFLFLGLFFCRQGAWAAKDIFYSPITPTPVVEYTLPFPGVLPDHPLYLVKAARDKILLFFTSNSEKRVHLNLLFADKRLVMGQFLWEKGNMDLSVSTISKSEKYLLASVLELLAMGKQKTIPPGLSDKLELAAKKHEEIILMLSEKSIDEQVKKELSQALGINHQASQQIQLIKQ